MCGRHPPIFLPVLLSVPSPPRAIAAGVNWVGICTKPKPMYRPRALSFSFNLDFSSSLTSTHTIATLKLAVHYAFEDATIMSLKVKISQVARERRSRRGAPILSNRSGCPHNCQVFLRYRQD